LEPDTGSIHFGTIDVLEQKDELRRRLGYLPQEFGVYPRISAQDMLSHLALLKGITRSNDRKEAVEAMLHRCNLYQMRKKPLAAFSGGMRQRFGIAQALIGNPQLLIVDEPTAGLDPGERNRFYNLLAEIGEQVIVILSTHIVEDVRNLCSRMAIIHLGRVLFAGRPDDAITALEGRVWQRSIAKAELTEYEQHYQVISSRLRGGRPVLHVLSALPPDGGFAASPPDLEDVFFTKTRGWN
jgi:ABC-type multidrug transport system ATPase subunit